MNRRRVLSAVSGVTALSVAGCLSTDDRSSQQPTVQVTQDSTAETMTVEFISTANADRVEVLRPDEGRGEGTTLTQVGESATVTDLSDGEQIAVVGLRDGGDTLQQTYTYNTVQTETPSRSSSG